MAELFNDDGTWTDIARRMSRELEEVVQRHAKELPTFIDLRCYSAIVAACDLQIAAEIVSRRRKEHPDGKR